MIDTRTDQELVAYVREQYRSASFGEGSDGEGVFAALTEIAARLDALQAMYDATKADNTAMYRVVFQAEDSVKCGTMHEGLIEAVEEYITWSRGGR